MDIYTSYFYQIRFFKPWMIPISTALSDPKWFHNNKGKDHIFIDKNYVINGLRIPALMPGKTCANLCSGTISCKLNPETCEFLKAYYDQLKNMNFNKFISWLTTFTREIYARMDQWDWFNQMKERDHDPILVFIFHEAPSNLCSERTVFHKWIKENGHTAIELKPKEIE